MAYLVVRKGLPHGKMYARGNDCKAEHTPAQFDHHCKEGLGNIALGLDEEPDAAADEQCPAKDKACRGELFCSPVEQGSAAARALDFERAHHEAEGRVGEQKEHGERHCYEGHKHLQDGV